MKYERFEQLPVWQAAIELARRIYRLTKRPPLRRERNLRDQIERAAVSISNNIAEGFERGTTEELLTFLYIARGSAAKVRSMLCLFESLFDSASEFADTTAAANFKSEISNLKLWLVDHLQESAPADAVEESCILVDGQPDKEGFTNYVIFGHESPEP